MVKTSTKKKFQNMMYRRRHRVKPWVNILATHVTGNQNPGSIKERQMDNNTRKRI